MMTTQGVIWLQKTVFWQRLILWALIIVWLLGLWMAMKGLFKLDNQGASIMIPYLLVVAASTAVSAYIIHQLYESVERTKAYLRSQEESIWLEALEYQRHFWKALCLLLLFLFGIGSIASFVLSLRFMEGL